MNLPHIILEEDTLVVIEAPFKLKDLLDCTIAKTIEVSRAVLTKMEFWMASKKQQVANSSPHDLAQWIMGVNFCGRISSSIFSAICKYNGSKPQ